MSIDLTPAPRAALPGRMRAGLPALPARMQSLRLDRRGYPVPWFVRWVNGEPDFRIIDTEKLEQALRFGNCWLCGQVVGKHKTFVIGPMCTINRVTSEPPCHHACAEFAARACPFLILPAAKRRESNLPADVKGPPGTHINRNPGAVCLWTTLSYQPMRVPGGFLLRLGDALETQWFAHGRPAFRSEALEALNGGLPFLFAEARRAGPNSVVELENLYAAAMNHLPAERLGDFL